MRPGKRSMTKADEKWDAIGDNPLVITSELRKFMSDNKWVEELEEFMQDEDVNKVLELVVKIIAGGVPEPSKIAPLMVRLEAYNIKFRSQFSAYMGYKKGTSEANMKKNHYKELYTGIDRLVDALKYLIK
jgi:hypothetical protein